MILDHELSQLSRPEVGIITSLGLVGLGTGIGLFPALIASVAKASAEPSTPFTGGDIANVAAFFFCFALTLVCLGIGGLDWWRNRGLAAKIRARTKRGITFSGGSSSNEESASPAA